MKKLLFLYFSLLLLGCVSQESIVGPPEENISFFKGVWAPFIEDLRNAVHDVDNLVDDGMNIVAIGVEICDKNETIVECHNVSEIKDAINVFHSKGLRTYVLLNPAHPYLHDATLEEITPLVLKWVSICEKYGVYMFSPLNEPQLVDNESKVSEWAQMLLPEMRKIYKGLVSFRVHHDDKNFPVYNLSGYDFVVFSGLAGTVDVTELPEHFKSIIRGNLEKYEKYYANVSYLLFDMGGFTGPDYYWWEPIAPENAGSDFWLLSEEQQAAFYEIFFNLTWNSTKGYFIPIYKGWEYRNKTAEHVIRSWFK